VTDSINLLDINRGSVTAPAGCGKTHLIADALARHVNHKPVLVLTHTNAGVAALRKRLDQKSVPQRAYRLSTIDGWAIRLISTFPSRSKYDAAVLELKTPKTDYPLIRERAAKLISSQHINDIIVASYERLIVDEYQDCNVGQHLIVRNTSNLLPTCVLGDEMQAIFSWPGNNLADWHKDVCQHFPNAGQLSTPWRWKNAQTVRFGEWLLEARQRFYEGDSVDLRLAPPEVTWIKLDGSEEDRKRQLDAARISAAANECVLIIGNSKNVKSQRELARQVHGSVTVENVDLSDLINFARSFKPTDPDALEALASFASEVMSNVGASDLVKRVGSLLRGTAKRQASDVEKSALEFIRSPSFSTALDVLVEMGKQPGVRAHRQVIIRSCVNALNLADDSDAESFYRAALRAREQNRLIGRPLHKRSVGSTLLLKGLEGEIAVVTNVADMDNAKHLYVAMTRGSKKLVVCSTSPELRLPL
jgi:hypothetical protein